MIQFLEMNFKEDYGLHSLLNRAPRVGAIMPTPTMPTPTIPTQFSPANNADGSNPDFNIDSNNVEK